VEVATPTLQQALFWMNLYRELLAMDETALQRMRALILAAPIRSMEDNFYKADVDLVVGEVLRVRRRLDHWLGIVAQMS
jgi:hypothetical protein